MWLYLYTRTTFAKTSHCAIFVLVLRMTIRRSSVVLEQPDEHTVVALTMAVSSWAPQLLKVSVELTVHTEIV